MNKNLQNQLIENLSMITYMLSSGSPHSLKWIFYRISYLCRKSNNYQDYVFYHYFLYIFHNLNGEILENYLDQFLHPIYRKSQQNTPHVEHIKKSQSSQQSTQHNENINYTTLLRLLQDKIDSSVYIKHYNLIHQKVEQIKQERKEKENYKLFYILKLIIKRSNVFMKKIKKKREKKETI